MTGIFIGILYVCFAIILYFFPPKKINMLYGYRSYRSMRNLEIWNSANRLFPFVIGGAGVISVLTGTLLHIIFGDSGIIPSIIAGILLFFVSLYVMEILLGRMFDAEGNRIH